MQRPPSEFPLRWAAAAGLVATLGLSAFAYYLGKSRQAEVESAPPVESSVEKPAPEYESRVYQSRVPGTKLVRRASLTPAGAGALRLEMAVDLIATNKQQVEGLMGEFETTLLPIDKEATFTDSDGVCELKLKWDNAVLSIEQKGICGDPQNPITEMFGSGEYQRRDEEGASATVVAGKCPPGTAKLICSNPGLLTANEAVSEVTAQARKAAQVGGAASAGTFDAVSASWRQDLTRACLEREGSDDLKTDCLAQSMDARIDALRHFTGVIQMGQAVAALERGWGKYRNAVDAYAGEYRTAALELPMFYAKARAMLGSQLDAFHDALEVRSQASANLFQAGCAAEGCPSGEAAFEIDPETGGVTLALFANEKMRVWSTSASSLYELPGALRVWVAERVAEAEITQHQFEPPNTSGTGEGAGGAQGGHGTKSEKPEPQPVRASPQV